MLRRDGSVRCGNQGKSGKDYCKKTIEERIPRRQKTILHLKRKGNPVRLLHFIEILEKIHINNLNVVANTDLEYNKYIAEE